MKMPLLLGLLFLCLGFQAFAQQQKPQVTIQMKDKTSVTGFFVQADPALIQVEVAGNTLKIKVADIVALIFAPEAFSGTPGVATPSAKQDGTAAALRALRKLANATEVGVSFQDYSTRLLDVKNEFEEAIKPVPDGEMKSELNLALQSYVDASTGWNGMLRSAFLMPEFEPGRTLMSKYSIPASPIVPGSRDFVLHRDRVLTTIWSAARARLERAASLAQGTAESRPATPEVSVKVEGDWVVNISTGSQTSQSTLAIEKVGELYRGAFRSQAGTTPVGSINVEGRHITAMFIETAQRQRFNTELSADIDGNRIKGTLRLTAANGQVAVLTFNGERVR